MLDSIPTEAITGFASLAGGAFAGLMANNQKMLLNSVDALERVASKSNDNSNAAAERAKGEASWLQRIVGGVIILVAFVGVWYAGVFKNIDITYIYETFANKFLGLFGGGEKVKTITAKGLVIPPYFGYAVISVVNFLFGASVVKLRRV